ncbi:serine/threonine-protein kinase Nek1-like isoform X3 [Ostrea edulis]|uniref:serine/threonine-protein kinase Nek1-like isoform X3 n=1 Tax=Ostrea edulis TaxID=37623 RepID=UPI0024AF544F|nr:serine/threonine-protein kinase Nek1-like isoform X3 [Ostrea edulis]
MNRMEKYVKIRQIGEGAFGKAILVRKKNDGKQYVIKEINIRKMGPKERQDSKKEVAVLAQLSHPNIVTYRESFEEIGSLYIVMDFCEKGDLYGKINGQRGILFPEDQVMDWFVQICLAVKHIHDRKILHRDIKSQNIFLSADGSLRLGDFGIAKVLGSTVELARTCIGTPYYLSPEIVENRPYNNKSDVWSLGCVLYEMATLKHAFEAGNMKNLVLKIIRGSYPPISPKYSYDLRGLIAQLFKRAPKERPSVNSILKKPFVQKRVSKFLSEDVIADEFSHTVMHGQKLARALPPPPPASRPPAPRKVTPAKPQKYNPASIYGAPIVRKSQEKRQSAEKKRPGSAGPSRPGSAASRPDSARGIRPSNSNQDLKKKRQEFIDKEKKRQDEKIAVEKRHQDLMEKQKRARMNKAREEGWKNLMGPIGSDDGDKKEKNEVKETPRDKPRWPPPSPAGDPAGDKERGKYDQYHDYLDKLERDRDQRKNNPQPVVGNNAAAYMAAPRVADPAKAIPNWRRPVGNVPAPTPVYQPPNPNRIVGMNNQAAERAKIVEDFVQRKREAAQNKQRGHADIFGNAKSYDPTPQPNPANDDQRPGSARNREEQEYLEKLRQIRHQNYQERRNLGGGNKFEEAQEQAKKNAELRRMKIEALRQQADDRAKLLKDQLEKDRKEMFEKEKRYRELGGAVPYKANQGRPLPAPPKPLRSPAPAVSMTGALNAIGAEPPKPVAMEPTSPAGMTSVLSAIGAKATEDKEEVSKSPDQRKKDSILKRLNAKGPGKAKWGKPEKPEIAEENSPPESARSQWGQGDEICISNLPLEQTASQMEATSARDEVVKHPVSDGGDSKPKLPEKKWGGPSDTLLNKLESKPGDEVVTEEDSGKPKVPEKKKWGRPSNTLLNALADKPVVTGTVSAESTESASSPEATTSSPEATSSGVPSVSTTITISKPPVVPIRQGTITISKDGPQKEGTVIGATITVDKPVIITGQVYTSPGENPESTNQESESKTTKEETDQSESTDKSNSKNDKLSDSPPKCSDKPPLPSKPVLPKPVILPKPDKPMQFGDSGSVPQAVKTEGAGDLFTKPDTGNKPDKPDNQESKNETVKEELPVNKKRNSAVILGITCGEFDIGNAQMLRTCSEPDLAKLTRTAEFTEIVKRTRKQSLDLEKLKSEEEEDEEELLECLLANVNNKDGDSEDKSPECPVSPLRLEEDQSPELEEENNEDGDDEDDEDLMSVRETMQSLLLREYSTDEEKRASATLNLTESKEDDIRESDEDSDKEGVVGKDNGGEEDNEEEEVEERDQSEDPSESLDSENQSENVDNLFQSDDSDHDTQFGDDDDFDLFSRLEESRAELESELGCDKFLKVYKTVQALQEDEDENIEEGAKLVTNILGKDKEHLYPKIFQLVIADAAFTEEQNESKIT